MHQFLTELFSCAGGVRGVSWKQENDPREVREWIVYAAKLLAMMRSEPVREAAPERDRHDYTPEKRETPRRAYAVLYNLARGHALVHGRTQLTWEDLPLVAQVTVSTMPPECRLVFKALLHNQGAALTTAQVQAALRVRHPMTAIKVMEELDQRGVMKLVKAGQGRPWELHLQPEWEWCVQDEGRELFLGEW